MAAYLAVSVAIIWGLGSRLGTEIFPTIDTGQFRLRIRAPAGTDIDHTEQIVLKALASSAMPRERTTWRRASAILARSAPATRSMACFNGCGGRKTRSCGWP